MKKLHFLFLANLFSLFAIGQWNTTGNDIYNNNTGKVGIGLSSGITEKLTLNGSIQLYDYDNSNLSRYIRLLSRFNLQATTNSTNSYTRGLIGQGISWDNSNSVWRVDGGDSYSDFGAIRFENGGSISFFTRPSTGSAYNLTHSQMDSYRRLTVSENGNVGIGVYWPGYSLEVNGNSFISNGLTATTATTSGIAGYFRGATNGNANIVLAGNVASYQWWWLTGANGILKIGGNGGTEPSQGAINIDYLGNVSIGTTNNAGYKLAVNGTAIFTEAKVKLYANWPDYVFQPEYNLLSLAELEKFLKGNNHLPNMPSAEEIKKDGIQLGDMTSKLLEKIEELTLYIIQLKKENDEIKEQLRSLK